MRYFYIIICKQTQTLTIAENARCQAHVEDHLKAIYNIDSWDFEKAFKLEFVSFEADQELDFINRISKKYSKYKLNPNTVDFTNIN